MLLPTRDVTGFKGANSVTCCLGIRGSQILALMQACALLESKHVLPFWIKGDLAVRREEVEVMPSFELVD